MEGCTSPEVTPRSRIGALLLGALGSLGFLLRAGQRNHSPPGLMALMALWVLAPFAALAVAYAAAKHWPDVARARLVRTSLIVALGSLAVYGVDALHPLAAKAAVPFVIVPAAAWLLLAIAPPAVWLAAKRAP